LFTYYNPHYSLHYLRLVSTSFALAPYYLYSSFTSIFFLRVFFVASFLYLILYVSRSFLFVLIFLFIYFAFHFHFRVLNGIQFWKKQKLMLFNTIVRI